MSMPLEHMERMQWFLQRIGKVVWRNAVSCKCSVCEHVYANGLLLADESHATYVYDCECISNIEGHSLRYFDTMEERDKFEAEQK